MFSALPLNQQAQEAMTPQLSVTRWLKAVSYTCLLLMSVSAWGQKETAHAHGIVMVAIPAGSFMMGSCAQDRRAAFLGDATCVDPDSSPTETPQRRVQVPAFEMQKTEVTLGQFKAFIRSTGRVNLVDDDFMRHNGNGDDAPVVQVSWYDAQAFIDWLNQTQTGGGWYASSEAQRGGWRLPSEAEWEYACRAGMNTKFCTRAATLDAGGWYEANSGGRPRNAGGRTANAWGLHDMSGNVWEWVQDCWHDTYSAAPVDGSAWIAACTNDGRVVRGGSWSTSAARATASSRSAVSPGYRFVSHGFRLARSVSAP